MRTTPVSSSLWLLTAAALGAWLAVMSVDTQTPYTYDVDQSYFTSKRPDYEPAKNSADNPAPQGSTVTVNWKMAERPKRLCPGTVMRVFTDERQVPEGERERPTTLDATSVSNSVRMTDDWLRRSFVLPPDLPHTTGYSGRVCFQCNLLQRLFPTLLCVPLPKLILHVQ